MTDKLEGFEREWLLTSLKLQAQHWTEKIEEFHGNPQGGLVAENRGRGCRLRDVN